MSRVSTMTNLLLEAATDAISTFTSPTPNISSNSSSDGNSSDHNNTGGVEEGAAGTSGGSPPVRPVMYRPPDPLVSTEVANDVAEAVYCYILPSELVGLIQVGPL